VLPAATLQGLVQRRAGPWSGQRVKSPTTAQRCVRLAFIDADALSARWPRRRGWLATWPADHGEADAASVPAYVQRELGAYLACGILAHGFARARCADCTAEFLIA